MNLEFLSPRVCFSRAAKRELADLTNLEAVCVCGCGFARVRASIHVRLERACASPAPYCWRPPAARMRSVPSHFSGVKNITQQSPHQPPPPPLPPPERPLGVNNTTTTQIKSRYIYLRTLLPEKNTFALLVF